MGRLASAIWAHCSAIWETAVVTVRCWRASESIEDFAARLHDEARALERRLTALRIADWKARGIPPKANPSE